LFDMNVNLIDVGTGNLSSVHKALETLGAKVKRVRSPEDVLPGERIVLPGVGAFGDFMQGLHSSGLDPVVREAVQHGVPLLGICVGMQALFEASEEMGEHAGLGLLPGRVVRFSSAAGYKVPHTGWNQLWPLGSLSGSRSPLLEGLKPGDYAYFNHSYYCAPTAEADIFLSTDYGLNFASAVQRGSLFGVQFHPEKSQQVGLNLLEKFLKVT
jgi:imidazole glycerol-phosphate synthase subunit HisH